MNSSLAKRFSFLLLAGIHFGEFFLGREVFFRRNSYIAGKSDFIKCGASLKLSSIKNPWEKRLKVGKSIPMIHIS